MKHLLSFMLIFMLCGFCSEVSARKPKKINNLFELLKAIDQYRSFNKETCNYRDVRRHRYLPQEVSDAIFASDTIYVLTGEGYDYVYESFFESVRGDSVHYYNLYAMLEDTIIETKETYYVDELIMKGSYIKIPYRKSTRDEDPFWYTKVVRENEEYHFSTKRFIYSSVKECLYLVQEEN